MLVSHLLGVLDYYIEKKTFTGVYLSFIYIVVLTRRLMLGF